MSRSFCFGGRTSSSHTVRLRTSTFTSRHQLPLSVTSQTQYLLGFTNFHQLVCAICRDHCPSPVISKHHQPSPTVTNLLHHSKPIHNHHHHVLPVLLPVYKPPPTVTNITSAPVHHLSTTGVGGRIGAPPAPPSLREDSVTTGRRQSHTKGRPVGITRRNELRPPTGTYPPPPAPPDGDRCRAGVARWGRGGEVGGGERDR